MPDDTVRFDLHVHTREHSKCALAPAVEALRLAAEQGLHGVAFTDHHYVWSAAEMDQARASAGVDLILVSGQEITFQGVDFLVFGWDGDLSAFTTKRDFVRAVRDDGGVVVVAHPFSALYYLDPPAIAAWAPHGVEVFNTLKGGPTPSERRELQELGLAETGGSDFHQVVIPGSLGDCWTSIDAPVAGLDDLMRAIRERRTVAVRG